MTSFLIKAEPHPFTVDVSSFIPNQMTSEQFYAFCLVNQDLRIERSASGDVIVMPPAFSDTGNRNLKIAQQIGNWSDESSSGETFDSSAGFTLPNGATRSPDVAWIAFERWNALTPEEQASFAPICPDFVVELRSASDTLSSSQAKLDEYIKNGARLGLLIDRKNQTVHIYRPGITPQILQRPSQVNCDPELP
ncbi:MAG: Uma2 family endonuclease, partial [Merismopedia sp. SIO2A8]|nr:Uma2 family endonuclease [Merismopedia sp. SIO2A8]